jgi:uncharacterized protein
MLAQRPPEVRAESVEFWRGCEEGKLLVQRCVDCSAPNWFPRTFCRQCSSRNLVWEDTGGGGYVEESTIVYRPLDDTYRDEVPYVLAVIMLDAGYHMISRVVGSGALEVQLGDPVRVTFVPTHGGPPLPVFELAEG